MDTPNLVDFPLELKRKLCRFLPPDDAFALGLSCKSMHHSLCLRWLPVRSLFQRRIAEINLGQSTPFVKLPSFGTKTHSLTVSFRWRDQGWGRSAGTVAVKARREGEDAKWDTPGGRCVCVSGKSPHELAPCKLTFGGREKEYYRLWYTVGAAGDSKLVLENGFLHTLIFDDLEANLSRNYIRLAQLGAVAPKISRSMPHLNLWRSAAKDLFEVLLQKEEEEFDEESVVMESSKSSCSNMQAFFESNGVSVSEASLLAIEEIADACEHELRNPFSDENSVESEINDVFEQDRQEAAQDMIMNQLGGQLFQQMLMDQMGPMQAAQMAQPRNNVVDDDDFDDGDEGMDDDDDEDMVDEDSDESDDDDGSEGSSLPSLISREEDSDSD